MYPSFTLLKEIVAIIVGTRNPFGIIGIALIWTFLAREEQSFASIKAVYFLFHNFPPFVIVWCVVHPFIYVKPLKASGIYCNALVIFI